NHTDTMATLDFKGKALVQNYHLSVKYHELVPKRDRSLTDKVRLDDNLIIHGDNLKALKALLPTYAGKVKCIYVDPPYNTGNEGWAYNDNVNSPMMLDWFFHDFSACHTVSYNCKNTAFLLIIFVVLQFSGLAQKGAEIRGKVAQKVAHGEINCSSTMKIYHLGFLCDRKLSPWCQDFRPDYTDSVRPKDLAPARSLTRPKRGFRSPKHW